MRFRVRRAAMSGVQGVLTVGSDLAERLVTVVNTHLVANSDDDYAPSGRFYNLQRAQLRRLNRVLSRPRRTEVAVITGDFNIASASAASRRGSTSSSSR